MALELALSLSYIEVYGVSRQLTKIQPSFIIKSEFFSQINLHFKKRYFVETLSFFSKKHKLNWNCFWHCSWFLFFHQLSNVNICSFLHSCVFCLNSVYVYAKLHKIQLNAPIFSNFSRCGYLCKIGQNSMKRTYFW